MFLKNGERGLLVGQTGSGKTQDAIFQLRHAAQWPIVIFDTKIEPDFFGVPEGDDSIELVESIQDFEKYSRKLRRDYDDYILVRPSMDEIQNFETLDMYSRIAYDRFGKALFYYDEMYNWHNRGVPGNGLVGMLTRGRSKGKTMLMASQRPGWISRFCITESQKFYIHRLTDMRDKKALSEVIPDFHLYPDPAKFHFYHYEIGNHEAPQMIAPVPYQKLDKSKIFSKKWI